MATDRCARIDDSIRAAEGELADARQQHAEYALKIVDSPGDEEAARFVVSLEKEIADTKRKIKLLEAAKDQARQRDSDEQKIAEVATFRARRDAVAARLTRMADIARQRADLRAQDADLAAQFDAIARENHSPIWQTLRSVYGPTLAERKYDYDTALAARGGRVVEAVEGYPNALPNEQLPSLDDMIVRGQHRVLRALDDAIAAREAEVGESQEKK